MSVAAAPTPGLGPSPTRGERVAARRDALRARVRAVPTWAWLVAGCAALLGVSVALRTTALHAGFWTDEGIAVGLSDRPIWKIPGVLRLDGSPPAYYLQLSLWMSVFGTGQATTHVLSLLWALLSIPIALWTGRSLFDARTGWVLAGLATVNPFLTYYAQETRMYAMMATLSLAMVALFCHVFVLRRRRLVVPFGLLVALVIYTHNYGLYLSVGSVVALLVVLKQTSDRRGVLRDAVLAYGLAGLLYLPWVPTLLFQAAHTGAPWSVTPTLAQMLGPIANMLGGPTVPLGLLLAVGAGVATILKAPAPRVPGVALERPRHTLTWVVVVLPVATALVLWLANQASPAFATRYFAVLVGPILVLAAVGLSHAGKLGLVALAIVLALQFNPRTHELETKSNARTVAAEIRQSTYPGDLVVTIHPEQTPVLYYYLRDRGLRYADAISMVGDPGVFDWRDSLERLKAAKPTPTLRSYVSGMRPGQTLVLALPIIRGSNWSAPWTALVRKRSAQWARAADASRQLERIRIAPKFVNRRLLPRGLRVVFYRKVADAPARVTAGTPRG